MDTHKAVERLRAAALELAATRPAEELTVGAICAAAGLNREEFYRYASSPVQLLAEALGDELLSQYDNLEGTAEAFDTELRARLALAHIAKWIDVYRGPIREELMVALRKTLAPSFRMMQEERLRRRPELLPEGFTLDDDWAVEFMAAYFAGGGMAAIEVWVDSPDVDIEQGMALIAATTPSGWFPAHATPADETAST